MSIPTSSTEASTTPALAVEPLITAGALAAHLGVHINWVYKEAKARRIPSIRVGSLRRFRITAVERELVRRVA